MEKKMFLSISIFEICFQTLIMELPTLNLESDEMKRDILEKIEPLIIDNSKCTKLESVFNDELEKGLTHGLEGSSIQMENTYIPELLNGTESGQYLALDLGGTNFR